VRRRPEGILGVFARGPPSHLLERLLQAGLLGDRQRAHRVPAAAELLDLNLDPRRVVAPGVHQVPGRALQGLHAAGPLAQLLLERLRGLWDANGVSDSGRGVSSSTRL